MHSSSCPALEDAGSNLLLQSAELANAQRYQIAAMNLAGESARLRRKLEDSEIRANGLQTELLHVRRENDHLRMMLGLPYLPWGRLPTPYPDSDVAKLLGQFCRTEQYRRRLEVPRHKGPSRAKALDLEGCSNFKGTVS